MVFPGSNCDNDLLKALGRFPDAEVSPVFWHEKTLPDLDMYFLPGGFSYGDYLRCGAIAAAVPVARELKKKAGEGKIIVGICNGFQILTELHLLPGALLRNINRKFICRPSALKADEKTLFAAHGKNKYRFPIAHCEGRYHVSEKELTELENNREVIFRYAENPNGSLNDIAGIRKGNVFGLMPHPERAVLPSQGSTDGVPFFEELIGLAKSGKSL